MDTLQNFIATFDTKNKEANSEVLREMMASFPVEEVCRAILEGRFVYHVACLGANQEQDPVYLTERDKELDLMRQMAKTKSIDGLVMAFENGSIRFQNEVGNEVFSLGKVFSVEEFPSFGSVFIQRGLVLGVPVRNQQWLERVGLKEEDGIRLNGVITNSAFKQPLVF